MAAAGAAALHGVLVTYRRPRDLATMLERLAEQQRPPDTLVVVDNDPDRSARAVGGAAADNGGIAVTYLPSGANLGPAGGIAFGMRHVLSHAADCDWAVLLDDDDPPTSPALLTELMQLAERLRADHPSVGGIGLCGARFETSRGRSVPVPDDELAGPVPTDWIGSGHFPLYSVRAIREVGVFDDRLFFGFDDLDYGLRLVGAGYGIYAHGDLWHRQRAAHGRLGLDRSPARTLDDPTWRRYYSLRNLIYILRKRGQHGAAARLAARGLGKPVYNLPRAPRLAAQHLALNTRAIVDAYRGRMGQTVRPVPKA